MKATVEKIENSQKMMEVEVENQRLEEAVGRTYRILVKKYNIPGFRKGKAPRNIFEQFVGTDYLYQEAADEILSTVYAEALDENGIDPIDHPELEIVQLEPGKSFIFRAKVTVMPEVTLGQYKGLEITRHLFEINEEQINNQLKSLQEKHARLVTLDEGEVAFGDTAMIDFEGFLGGVAFEGGKGEDYALEIGSGSFVPGFEDQLVGQKIGEEKEINVTFPENYHGEDLAGKDVIFNVKINSIRRKELSELDDEFAQDVSEFDTLAELKEDLKNKMEEHGVSQGEAWLRDQAVEKAGENAAAEIPQVLVDRQIEAMIGDLERNLQTQGLDLEQYFMYTGLSRENLKEEYAEGARKAVLSELVLEAIAKEENIEATDEDLEVEYEKMAERFEQDVQTIKDSFVNNNRVEGLKYNLALDKTVEFLIENAVITEEKVTNQADNEEQKHDEGPPAGEEQETGTGAVE
ncbi:MAG: trigger factor [Bacillota bacterium]